MTAVKGRGREDGKGPLASGDLGKRLDICPPFLPIM